MKPQKPTPQHCIFLPGTLCDRALFAPQIARVSKAGWGCAVWDYDGFTDLDAWAEDNLRRAPDEFALVGLSLGGIAAMALLRHAAARVSHLALLDTNPAGDTAQGVARREEDYRQAQAIGLERFIAETMIPRQLHPDNAGDEPLREVVLGMARRTGMSRWRGQLDLLKNRPDSREMLKTLKMPTLIGCGEEDRVCPPAMHREMAGLMPQAKLVMFSNSGHLATLEAAGAVSGALGGLLGGQG